MLKRVSNDEPRRAKSKAARFFSGPGGTFCSVLFWLLVWQLAAQLFAEPVLLPSPFAVAARLIALAGTGSFWQAVLITGGRIVFGFLLAFAAGILLASLAAISEAARALLTPPLAVIKSTPVASVILLMLIWFKPAALPLLVAALFVLPLVFSNLLEGIASVDAALLEMADSFRFGRQLTVRTIYLPAVRPALIASARTGTAVSFKAGVAAEIIAVPAAALGSLIYEAKIHLATADLFALTVAVVLCGVLFEYGFGKWLSAAIVRLERPGRCTAAKQTRGEPPQTVELDEVSFRYRTTWILDHVTAAFPSGRHTIVSGPSGAGKTTMLRLLTGYLKPESGQIRGVSRRPAVVFQEDRLLLHLSAEENLAVVSPDIKANREVLKAMGVEASQLAAQLSGKLTPGCTGTRTRLHKFPVYPR